MVEYELYHYGVPGMKWGVRRAANQADKADKQAAKAERKKLKQAAKAERKQFKKDVKDYQQGKYKDRNDLSFTGDMSDNGDGTFSLANARYYSGNKRISAEKFHKLDAYSRTVAAQAAKDTKRQQAGRNAVTAFVGLGLTVGALVANRYR